MCFEITTIYTNCKAIRVHLNVCAEHIEHTRQQLDNVPCPNFNRDSRMIADTTRCFCKETVADDRRASRSRARAPGYCARAASKGYGENGLTWHFERGPAVLLKGKKERAREKVEEEEKQESVKVKLEPYAGEESLWAAAATAGWVAGNGRYPKSEEDRQRGQPMWESYQPSSKKVKKEYGPYSSFKGGMGDLSQLKPTKREVDVDFNDAWSMQPVEPVPSGEPDNDLDMQ